MVEIRLHNLPKSWTSIKLRDVIDIIPLTGKKLKQSEYLEEGKVPVIDQGQSFIGGYTDKVEMKINCTSPVIVFGDHTKVIKYVNFDFIAGADGIKVIKPEEVFIPKLFFYFLQAVPLPDRGYSRHFQFLEKSLIPIPPLPEQHRIVAKIEELFSDLDAGAEALRKAKAQLRLYRQAVLKAAFEGRLTAAWREAHKVEKFIGDNSNLIQENAPDLFALPRGWGWAKLNIVCNKIQDGSHFSPKVQYDSPAEGRYLYITAKNIKENGIDLSNVTYVDNDFHKSIIDRCNPGKGDVLLIKDGVKTGIAAINQLKTEFSLLSSVALFKTNKMILLPHYLKHYLNSPVGFRMITGQMTGTAIKRIILDKLRTSYIPLAPFPEQQKIVEEIERLLSIANEVENSIDRGLKQSRIMRQSILKKAFQGGLVPQDPEDEPAAELLKRIKAEKAGHPAGRRSHAGIKRTEKLW